MPLARKAEEVVQKLAICALAVIQRQLFAGWRLYSDLETWLTKSELQSCSLAPFLDLHSRVRGSEPFLALTVALEEFGCTDSEEIISNSQQNEWK